MTRTIPIVDLHGRFAATEDEQFAFVNGYIGEMILYPRKLAKEIGEILGITYRTIQVFYYGTPDDRLKDLFGYE